MAAVDYFLKLTGIPGESADSKHATEIDIESWWWGQSNAGTFAAGGGGGAGKVNMQDFSFVMRVNQASPKLFLACATGQHIQQGVLTCRKAGKEQQEYLKITFTDLLVSSFQTSGGTSPGATSGGNMMQPRDISRVGVGVGGSLYGPGVGVIVNEVIPTDTVTINFAKIEYSYAPQKKDGSLGSPVVHHYDLKAQVGA